MCRTPGASPEEAENASVDQSVCPSCWTWYPLGTRSCKPCGTRLGGGYAATGVSAPRPFQERRPASVIWARRAVALHTTTVLALLAYASTSLMAAETVYGPFPAISFSRQIEAWPGGPATVIAGALVVAAVSIGLQLLVARWLVGRMVLLLGIAADLWYTLVSGRADPRYLSTSIGLATALIAIAMLGWSVARPTVRWRPTGGG